MFRKLISIAVIIAIVNLTGIVTVFAKSNAEKELRLAIEVKQNIRKLGASENSKVKISLKDKSNIQGYVSEIQENSFTVTDSKTGRQTEVEYSQVKKVKGNNLSTGVKIGIGIGVAVAVLAIVVLANRKICKNALCQ